MNFESIVSKIVAGGLTAGIFLFWWPTHFSTEGIEPLILRGLLSTLFFELVLLSVAPLERRVTERLQLRTQERRTRVRARLEAAPERARTGGVVALACLSVGAPLALIAGGPHQLVKKPEPVQVVREVVVEKPVVKRQVIVKRVTVPAASASAPAKQVAPAPTPVAERVTGATPRAAAAATPQAAKTTTTTKAEQPAAKGTTKAAPVEAPAETTPAPASTGTATPAKDDASATATATAGADDPAPAPAQP